MSDPCTLVTGRHTVARGITVTLCGFIAAIALAGCDGEEPLTQNKLPRPGPEYTVPPVQHPLDLAKYLERACSILHAEQVDQLELPGDRVQGVHACRWEDSLADAKRKDGNTGSFTVSVRDIGLPEVFAINTKRQNPQAGVYGSSGPRSWEPTTVAGYPAAHTRPRSPDICSIEVGVSYTQSFEVSDTGAGDRGAAVGEGNSKDACARTTMTAEFIIDNLMKQSS